MHSADDGWFPSNLAGGTSNLDLEEIGHSPPVLLGGCLVAVL